MFAVFVRPANSTAHANGGIETLRAALLTHLRGRSGSNARLSRFQSSRRQHGRPRRHPPRFPPRGAVGDSCRRCHVGILGPGGLGPRAAPRITAAGSERFPSAVRPCIAGLSTFPPESSSNRRARRQLLLPRARLGDVEVPPFWKSPRIELDAHRERRATRARNARTLSTSSRLRRLPASSPAIVRYCRWRRQDLRRGSREPRGSARPENPALLDELGPWSRTFLY